MDQKEIHNEDKVQTINTNNYKTKDILNFLGYTYNPNLQQSIERGDLRISEEQITELLELSDIIPEPSIIRQIQSNDPDFSKNSYTIIKTESSNFPNPYVHSNKISTVKGVLVNDSNTCDLNDKEAIENIKKIISQNNVLIIPQSELSYHSDQPYPLMIFNEHKYQKRESDFLKVYGSDKQNYRMNKYRGKINTIGILNMNQILQIMHSKDTPYIAFSHKEFDTININKDWKIKGIQEANDYEIDKRDETPDNKEILDNGIKIRDIEENNEELRNIIIEFNNSIRDRGADINKMIHAKFKKGVYNNDKLIGFEFSSPFEGIGGKTRLSGEGIYINPQYQGKGLAKRLLIETLKIAEKEGYEGLSLGEVQPERRDRLERISINNNQDPIIINNKKIGFEFQYDEDGSQNLWITFK